MSTHLDGAGPSLAPDPDDGEPHDDTPDAAELGSEWVRAEMLRRMAANRSTRGRHARGGEAALPERDGPGTAEGLRLRKRSRPEPAPPPAPVLPPPPAVPQPPQPPPSWGAGSATPADLPENYVPRHSVQTPGPAADPATTTSGPSPVVRPPVAPDAPAPEPPGGGPLGGPSLSPAGLPMRRRRSAPPADGATTAGPWTRPGPIVPTEPTRRLGAPPGRLGAPEPIPSWGLPPVSPPHAPGSTRPAGAETEDAGDGDTVEDRIPVEDRVATDEGTAAHDGTATGDDTAGDDVEVTDPTGARVDPVVDRAPTVRPVAPDVPPRAEPAGVRPVAAAATPAPTVAPTAVAPTAVAPPVAPPAAPAASAASAAPAEAEVATGVPAPDTVAGPVDPPAAGPAGDGAPGATARPEPAPAAAAEVTDLPTAPHPVVLAPRGTRSVALPSQRSAEQARTVAPRPLTPRHIPVVGNAPVEPGSTRVRVVLSERKGVARAVRTIKEVQEGTAVGELLRRDLISSQLKVTLRFALLTVVVLGALPTVFALLPQVSRFHVLGLRLPWVLLGVLMYPFLVGVAWRYTRVADRVEQSFADHVQD